MLMNASTIFARNNYYIKLINIEVINNIITGFLVIRNLDEKYYYKQKVNIPLPNIVDIINGKITHTLYKIADKEYKIKILHNKKRDKIQIIFDKSLEVIELD